MRMDYSVELHMRMDYSAELHIRMDYSAVVVSHQVTWEI